MRLNVTVNVHCLCCSEYNLHQSQSVQYFLSHTLISELGQTVPVTKLLNSLVKSNFDVPGSCKAEIYVTEKPQYYCCRSFCL